MSIDFTEKSTSLLNNLANSLYERDPSNPKPVFFNIKEIQLVEEFLKDLIKDYDCTQ